MLPRCEQKDQDSARLVINHSAAACLANTHTQKLTLKVLTHWEQGDTKQINANICQHDTNMHLKFAQLMKFRALSVALEKNSQLKI